MNNELFRYRLLLRLLAPLILVFNAWQALRARDIRIFRHRLGVCLPRRTDAPLWLHAASVGELIAAQPLITELKNRFPKIPIVVTTVTPTGAKLAQQRLPADVQHFYLPMDWPGATARFLHAVKPRAALIMETELWPNLFTSIARHDIPLIIINGRLSTRSRDAAGWIKMLYAVALKNVNAVLARSKDDADAYIKLGAAADKVRTLGNIKFSIANNKALKAIDLGRPYVLAASTHNDEEKQLGQLWKNLDEQTQDRLLVIAPRHPKRLNSILEQLKPSFTREQICVRSQNEDISANTRIYLADTLGELEGFMAGADFVFMGGSLIPHGGQNILEPARLGKPIIFGPHMSNFAEETQLLLQENAAKQITDEEALRDAFSDWLAHPQASDSFGKKAAALMSAQNTILDDYLSAITETCALESDK